VSSSLVGQNDRLVYQDSIRHLLDTAGQNTRRVDLLNKLANSYFAVNRDSAAYIAGVANTLAQKLSYSLGVANTELTMGLYYRLEGDKTTALKKVLSSIKIFEQLGNKKRLASAYLEIAQLYKAMSGGNNTVAYINQGIFYSKAAYDLYEQEQDTDNMVSSLNVEGIIYRDLAKNAAYKKYYDTAYDVYTKALALIKRTGKGEFETGKIYNNISQIYTESRKDYNKALEYLFKAVAFNQENHNFGSLAYNYSNISNCYSKLNQHVQALLYAYKTLEVSRQINEPERIKNAYGQLYVAFNGNKQYDSALHYYILSERMDDSLTNLAKNREVVDLQTKYETGKKEAEILRLQLEGHVQNKRIALLISALGVFAALAGWMLWLYRRIKKQRQQITAQSHRLEIMMKELHHRVKNNLQIVSSLLSLQTYRVQDEGTVLVLKESQQRVQAMSFIHQRLYKKESLTAVNMKEYLTDLAESLVSSYGFNRDEFDLQLSVEKEMMDIEQALPIGLIINELMTNALKYAYGSVNRPALHIELREDASNTTFSIKDNGSGINEQEWKQKNNSFGKQLIKALCKQLRAQQTLVIDGGTQFTITIPKQAA
jgi:two-component sensor histidine kinase